jgi:hypothetical protein
MKRMPMDVYKPSPLGLQAIELLEVALGQIRDGEDALPTISAADATLRVECGELSPDEIT